MASGAARSRQYRRRQRDGKRLAHIEIDEIAVTELLIHHGLLPAHGSDEREVIDTALKELVERLTAADAAQHNQ